MTRVARFETAEVTLTSGAPESTDVRAVIFKV